MTRTIRPGARFCAMTFALITIAVAPAASAQTTHARSDGERTPHVREGGETDRRVLWTLQTTVTYGNFSPTIGGLVRATGSMPLWNTAFATGTFDFGARVGVTNGAWFMLPWLSDDTQTGSDTNFAFTALVGHTFYMGHERRSSLALQVFVGANVQYRDWTLNYRNEGLSGHATAVDTAFVWGPEITYGYRFSRHVGAHVLIGGVCPCLHGATGSLLHVGAGVTVHLP